MVDVPKNFKIIGHRGAPLFAPENSLASFRKAMALGADAVETDVRMSSDGVPVLIHDPKIDRITDGEGFVRDLTLSEIKKARLDDEEEILTLEEFLDFIPEEYEIFLEIKDIDAIDSVLELVRRKRNPENTLISSYHKEVIEALENKRYKRTGLVTPFFLNSLKWAIERNVEAIVPIYWGRINNIGEKFVTRAHENGVKIYPFPKFWGKNIKSEKEINIQRLVVKKIDGLHINNLSLIRR